MTDILKRIVVTRLQQLTNHELIHYGRKYRFTISLEEANQLTRYIQTAKPNPFEAKDRLKMYNEISRVTNKETAEKAEQLFIKMIKEHGLEHLFE
ncbi:DUF2624 family protein [Virgibacillus sp. W0430]|uniref:DUF2624 family protein n=1 Tax=Virgibacillus sp. W0430 TaxID=3391580 RepID=UPI003F475241